jgi:predicted O-methyltransferase YrrM
MTDDIAALTRQIKALPADWHGAGSLQPRVLDALTRHLQGRRIECSMETGSGRTTLLLSHLSERHLVFVRDDEAGTLRAVRESPLLAAERTEFVIGSTQQTLLHHTFDQPLDVAFLDGPHAYPFPDLEYWAVYPNLRPGALLVIDDIHIRTIANLYRFVRADAMYDLAEVVDNTAFFTRTAAPTHDPYGDDWTSQRYNRHVTYRHLSPKGAATLAIKRALPPGIKERLRPLLHRR